MLKRILVDVVVTLCVIALSSGFVVGYFWLNGAPERAKQRKEAEELVAGLVAQKKALEALGDVDLETASLTLAKLNQKLNAPMVRRAGSHDSTAVGWACADSSCTFIASFMTPFGQEIPKDSAPVVIVMMKPIFSITRALSIDGIRLGSSVDDIERSCKKRGYGTDLASDKITCGDGWGVRWAASNGQAHFLVFTNERLLSQIQSQTTGPSNAAGGLVQ